MTEHGTAQAVVGLGGNKRKGHGSDVVNPSKANTKATRPTDFVRVVLVEGQNELGITGSYGYTADGKGTVDWRQRPSIDIDGMAVGDELVFFGVIRYPSPSHYGAGTWTSETFMESRDIAGFKAMAGGLTFATETDDSQSVVANQTVQLDDRGDYSDSQYLIVYLDLTP